MNHSRDMSHIVKMKFKSPFPNCQKVFIVEADNNRNTYLDFNQSEADNSGQ